MIEIYRRYNPSRPPSAPDSGATAPHVQRQQIFRETAPSKPESVKSNKAHGSVHNQPNPKPSRTQQPKAESHSQQNRHNSGSKQPRQDFSFSNVIRGFLPPTLYNRETKKLLGFFTAEDLLLIALILIFSESEENDDPFTILALIYILISDYIDLPDLHI